MRGGGVGGGPVTLDTIPSPGSNTIRVGGFQLHMYAVMTMAGIVVAVVISERRLRARGFPNGTAVDLVVWAVPCGIVGARLYHVITDWKTYFGAGGDPVRALYIWQGGLGIWGAIAGGGLGVYIAARRRHLSFVVVADAVAPALPVAQAIGRWGNWWNQEICAGRSVTEALRSDHASLVLGLRVNEWVSAGLFVVAVTYLVVVSRGPRRQGESGPAGVAEHASARPQPSPE